MFQTEMLCFKGRSPETKYQIM